MLYHIPAGRRRLPLMKRLDFFGLTKETIVAYEFKLGDNWVYDLPGFEDDKDINKFFGISLRLLPYLRLKPFKFVPGHQYESVRFSGYPEFDENHELTGRIQFVIYAYVKGVRKVMELAAIEPKLNTEQVDDRTFVAEVGYYRDLDGNIKLGGGVVIIDDGVEKLLASDFMEYASALKANEIEGKVKYRLAPYFGGTQRAPRRLEIYLKKTSLSTLLTAI